MKCFICNFGNLALFTVSTFGTVPVAATVEDGSLPCSLLLCNIIYLSYDFFHESPELGASVNFFLECLSIIS